MSVRLLKVGLNHLSSAALDQRALNLMGWTAPAHRRCKMLHRTRRLLITQRTMLGNALRTHFAESGRDFAAWLGLVPSQNSTGGKTVLGPITKARDRYLRSLLVVGATSSLWRRRAEKGTWLAALIARGKNLLAMQGPSTHDATGHDSWWRMADCRPHLPEGTIPPDPHFFFQYQINVVRGLKAPARFGAALHVLVSLLSCTVS